MNNDALRRFIFDHSDIRGEITHLDESYRTVLANNPLPAPAQLLLGEFLAAASLMSSTLKFDGLLSLQARGEGDLTLVMAECSHHNNLRGIARLAELAPSTWEGRSFSDLLGKGQLVITITPDKGERYQGIVPLVGDSLAACLEDYFSQSEQLGTRFWLAADLQQAAGLMLQALPRQLEASEEENQDRWETTVQLADTVRPEELLMLDQEQLLYRLFNQENVRLFEDQPLRFACSCSEQRSSKVLQSLGREEIDHILEELNVITVDCQFCNQRYSYGREDIDQLFAPPTQH